MCTAPFDLEANGGLLTAELCVNICQQVISKWSGLEKGCWTAANRECPKCLEQIVLGDSRILVKT